MIASGSFQSEEQIMAFLEEHKIELEDQPTELLVELSNRLKVARENKYPEEKLLQMWVNVHFKMFETCKCVSHNIDKPTLICLKI